MKKRILIATTNPSKKEYLKWVLNNVEGNVIYLDSIPEATQPEETGSTFKENAKIKAAHYSAFTDSLTICTDGGAIIPVLGNKWDSLLTHRFAGKNATDQDRVDALLELMKNYEGKERTVYFKEAVSLGKSGKVIFSFEAMSGPRMLTTSYDKKRFLNGFWLPNILYYPDLKKRYIDATKEELFTAPSTTHWRTLKQEVTKFLKAT